MEANEFYRIGFSAARGGERSSRVGLLHERTGVPLFLLYLEGLGRSVEFACHSLAELEKLAGSFSSPFDLQALAEVRGFFLEGGSQAQIVGSPISLKSNETLLAQMIGRNFSFAHRSGLFLLEGLSEQADLVAVPQARYLLSSTEENREFHLELLHCCEKTGAFFALIEPPTKLIPSAVIDWSQKLNSVDAAIYYPELISLTGARELSLRTERSALPAVAALYQKNDTERSVAELPTLGNLETFIPARKISRAEQMQLLQGRCNSLIFSPGTPRQVRVWGGHTLACPPETNFNLISVRRTLRALKEALESLAEAYVLEPLSADTILEIEYRMRGFLEDQRNLFDLYTRSPFEIKTNALSGRDSDGVEITCGFTLPRCVQRIDLNLGVKNV